MPLSLDQLARLQIKRWMDSTGIKQGELALRVGKNQSWMSRYLSEEFDADLEILHKMAGVFGHTLVQLLEMPGDPEERTLIAGYRALRPKARKILLQLVNDWTRVRESSPPSPRGGAAAPRATAHEVRRPSEPLDD
jgi:transcriptional regulator with XRE-family HTH domain